MHAAVQRQFAYTYSKRNRLAGVTRNTVSYATYGYNALEQLTTRTSTAAGAPVGQQAYTYDNDNHLITENTASTGAKVREYIWLPSNDNQPVDLPLAVIDVATNTMSYVHADHLGRPTRMTNAAKATVWQATWTPWGEAHTISGTVTNNLRTPGQYFQIETGLHDNHHRKYDPVTGRYTQPDPLRFVDGPSIYAYAGSSPYMNVDREGLASCTYSISEQRMVCVSNNSGSSQFLGPSGTFSGQDESMNCNSCTENKNEGPIPQGTYDMVRSDKYGGSYWLDEGRIRRFFNDRSEFFFHKGSRSNGCITVNKNDKKAMRGFNSMMRFLDNDAPNTMTVVD